MSKFRLDYEIEGVERTMTAIRRGIREGMEESADDLIGDAKTAAQDRIYSSRRIWNKEVYKYGWGEQDVDTLSPTRVTGRITNYSEHAYVVDEGYDPKWGRPPVQGIIDWVDSKVQGGWTMGDDEGGGGDPSATQLDTSSVARGDATIKEVITGQDAGVASSANSRNIRVLEYEAGDRGLFKPNEVGSSAKGVVENEAVVSRASDLLGWDDDPGIPVSRQRTITDVDGTDKTGNVMAFVEDADEIGSVVKNYHNPDAPQTPEEFGEQHVEWAARIGVLDYIVANDDRHTGNILIDRDGRPWAIDSGGHTRPSDNFGSQRQGRLLVFDEWENMDRMAPPAPGKSMGDGYLVEDVDKMKAVSNAILDRQEEIFKDLRNAETREEFVEMAENLHPDTSAWDGYYYDKLHPDSTARYRVYGDDEWDGDELWKHDIEEVRQWVEDSYENRQDTSTSPGSTAGVPWQVQTPSTWSDNSDITLTSMMDSLFGHLDDDS